MEPLYQQTIYPSQIKWLYRSLREKIKKFFILGCIAIFIYLILKNPPSYLAEATFKQSQNRSDDIIQLQSFLQNIVRQPADSDAITLMNSKKILRKVVEELGLQIVVNEKGFVSSIFANMFRNLAAELKIFVEDPESFEFSHVKSNQEKPFSFYLKFLSPECFEVFDEKQQPIAKGKLKESIQLSRLSFILEKTPKTVSYKKMYPAAVIPWNQSVLGLQKSLTLKPGKADKSLICLSYRSPCRHLSSEVLNSLMGQFQNYLKEEHEEIANAQLAYLEKRQHYLGEEFNKALENHAAYLAQNLGKNGFVGIAQEIEMLSVPKESYTSKLFDLDLELKRWHQLEEKRQDYVSHHEKKGGIAECQERLVSLNFQETQILSTQERPSGSTFEAQFLGIDLKRLQDLYGQYGHEKDKFQADVDQMNYIQEQMLSPHFELSSLSNLLSDPVSMEMITKASRLSLELHDESNRTPKEQERIKEALETQKRFISHHLAQSIQLFKIKLNLLEEKMAFLQKKAVQLIKNEKKLIYNKLNDLRAQMKDFPEKWLLENQLKLKKDLTASIIEGMTSLTESKIVHHHLFQVESKPLDLAIPPLLPNRPKLLFFSLMGGLVLGCMQFFYHLLKKIIHGFPLCGEWIKENNHHFSGEFRVSALKESKKSDLETLRNISGFISNHQKKVVPLLGGVDSSCAHALAELLAMQNIKTLIIETTFHLSQETTGLLQYLKGETTTFSPLRKNHYDYFPSGGYYPYGLELLSRPLFSSLIDELKTLYDCILILSTAKPDSLEVDYLLRYADGVGIMLKEETISEIKPLIDWQKNKNVPCLTFIKCQS